MKSASVNKAKKFNLLVDCIASDKSISHRSVIFSLLASGTTKIRNFLRAEDTMHSLDIAKALGADILDDKEIIQITTSKIKEPEDLLNCGNSGTSIRLFCALLASEQGSFILTGDKYLKRRPMQRITQPLNNFGALIDGRNSGNLAPLHIRGASLKAFSYTSKIASAQVKSALIIAALKADAICSYSEPELSRDHTERMLKGMGAKIKRDKLTLKISPLKKPLKPLDIFVPADPSSSFFLAVAAAITPNSTVTLKGVTLNPTRIEAFKILQAMGTLINYVQTENIYEPIGDITVTYRPLKAVTISKNISWLIDELPALAIAMSCAKGKSCVKNAQELRVKESNRILSITKNLKKCSIYVEEFDDGYTILGGTLKSATIDSFGDHRIAMSFLIAGVVCSMKVNDIDCIKSSFPNFFQILSQITRIDYDN